MDSSLVAGSQRKASYLLMAAGCALLVSAYFIGISDNLPGILAMMGGLFAFVLGIAYRFTAAKRPAGQQLLFWAPRTLCIVMAIFVSLFALDAFDGKSGVFQQILAFLVHLIPTYIVIIVLAVAWKWEWVGAAIFMGLGALYIVGMWGKFPVSTLALMGGPMLLIGILFLLNWRLRAQLR